MSFSLMAIEFVLFLPFPFAFPAAAAILFGYAKPEGRFQQRSGGHTIGS
jgi:hypothetical protein